MATITKTTTMATTTKTMKRNYGNGLCTRQWTGTGQWENGTTMGQQGTKTGGQ